MKAINTEDGAIAMFKPAENHIHMLNKYVKGAPRY